MIWKHLVAQIQIVFKREILNDTDRSPKRPKYLANMIDKKWTIRVYSGVVRDTTVLSRIGYHRLCTIHINIINSVHFSYQVKQAGCLGSHSLSLPLYVDNFKVDTCMCVFVW